MTQFAPARRSQSEAVKFTYATADQPVLTRAVIKTIEFCGGQRKLVKRYEAGRAAVARGESFYDMAIRMLALDLPGRRSPASWRWAPRRRWCQSISPARTAACSSSPRICR